MNLYPWIVYLKQSCCHLQNILPLRNLILLVFCYEIVWCFLLTGKHWFTLLCNILISTHKHTDEYISIVNILQKACVSASGIFMLGGIIIYLLDFPPLPQNIYERSFAWNLGKNQKKTIQLCPISLCSRFYYLINSWRNLLLEFICSICFLIGMAQLYNEF